MSHERSITQKHPCVIYILAGLITEAGIENAAKGTAATLAAKAAKRLARKSLQKQAAELAEKAGKNRVTTSKGDLDLQGASHYDKAKGKDIKTPHVHENRPDNVRPSDGKRFPQKPDPCPRKATQGDIDEARGIIDPK